METLTSAWTLTTFVLDVVSGIKDGPAHVKSTADKVLHFRNQLERAHQLCDENDANHAGLLNAVRLAAADISNIASKLRKVQVTPDDKVTGRMWKRVRTVLSEKDLDGVGFNITRHSAQIALHLDIMNSSKLRDHADRSIESLNRIERSAVNQTETVSQNHNELLSQFNLLGTYMMQAIGQVQKSVESMDAISADRAGVMHNTLTDILHQQQRGPIPRPMEQSSDALGQLATRDSFVREQSTASLLDDRRNAIYKAGKADHGLLESIERLSQLIHEKEHKFDIFGSNDDDATLCESIVDDLGDILTAARQRVKFLEGDGKELRNASRMLSQFQKSHGSHSLAFNTTNQVAYRWPKQPSSVGQNTYAFYAIPLSIGSLTLVQRKTVRTCGCGAESCVLCGIDAPERTSMDKKGARTESLTKVTVLVNRIREPFMIVATEQSIQSALAGFVHSMSSLILNPVIPSDSEVFKAVRSGDLQKLRILLQNGEASLRDTNEKGWSLLFFSCFHPSITRFLLDNGLDVNHVGDDEGYHIHALHRQVGFSILFVDEDIGRLYANTELLLEAGADPLVAGPKLVHFLGLEAASQPDGRAAAYARKAIASGSITTADVTSGDSDGLTLLHYACHSYHIPLAADNLAAVLGLGIDINAVDNGGDTCLSTFTQALGAFEKDLTAANTAITERDALIFLLRNGADQHWLVEVGSHMATIFQAAYSCHCERFCRGNRFRPLGGYAGDIWDSALSICGYNLREYRSGYQRRPRYTQWYTREAFETLWQGRQSECPYWDDQSWPASDSEGDRAPVCIECMDKGDDWPWTAFSP